MEEQNHSKLREIQTLNQSIIDYQRKSQNTQELEKLKRILEESQHEKNALIQEQSQIKLSKER